MPQDSLNSKQIAQVVDLLCEGEIEGFPNAVHPDGVKISRTTAKEQYFIGSLKDVFFNNTPVLAPEAQVNGDSKLTDPGIQQHLNFDLGDGVFENELGTQDQPKLSAFTNSTNRTTVVVNTEVPKATVPPGTSTNLLTYSADGSPVTQQITDADVDQVNVTVGVNALSRFKENGEIKGSIVRYKIQIQYNDGGGYSDVPLAGSYDKNGVYLGDGNFEIRGYTPDLYQETRAIVFNTAKTSDPNNFPINIRVIRTSQEVRDFSKETVNDTLTWFNLVKIVTDKTRYPNSVIFGHKFDAQQFPSIPRRSYRIRGLKVRIPHNATVRDDGSLEYSGTFNGTFKAAREYTNDPAFVLYDLLTNTRYGLGSYILTPEERAEAEKNGGDNFEGTSDVAANLDVYSFQQASAYCGTLVPDGFGGTEPRFSCNVCIKTQSDAFKLVQEMCSVFRAMPFWEAGGISLAQDRAEDFTYIFNQSNVTEEGFSYSGSSMKGRPTCVSVKYFDNDARDFRTELVELNSQFVDSTDPNIDFLEKYGYNKKEIVAFACTSRGQAYRLGKWFLYTAHRETEVCSFQTDMAAGITVRPGDYIKISDPVRGGRVVSGRVTSGSTTTAIKLDRSDTEMFGASAPPSFEFHTILPDGSFVQTTSSIVGNTVTPNSALALAPAAGAPFNIGYSDIVLTKWRVLTVEEGEGVYSITASAHEPRKFDIIEDPNARFGVRSFTQLGAKPDAVTNLQLEEELYEEGDKVLQRIKVNWQQSLRANEYEVEYQLDVDNSVKVTVPGTAFDILDSRTGAYTVSVRAVGYDLDVERTGKRFSSPTTATINAVGKNEPPSNIGSLNITPIDQHTAELHWPEAGDLDVRIGGTIEIRHNPRTTGDIKWSQSEKIVPTVNGSTTRKIVPLKDGHYLVRAKDSVGNYAPLSGIPSVLVDLPEPQDLEVVQTFTESPSFPGTFSQTFNSTTEGGITLQADGQIDDITDFDSVTNIDFFGDVVPVGSYIFQNTLDLGAKYDVELLANLQINTINPDDFWDSRSDNIDTWNDIDADDLSETNAELYSRSTNDDPNGASPSYGTWEPFANSTKRGRGFQFKVEMETDNDSQDVVVQTLGVTVSLQRRTEQERDISSGTAAKAVTFPSAFYSTPSITITATNMATGDFFELSSVSRTGFTITFKDSGGTIVDRNFDYQAVGHGKEIT
ncbi:MAG: host specificity protein J [Proteobacteria bacterium]|nr:MAG: host specificity protein J [Pseudomonadota bacterium]